MAYIKGDSRTQTTAFPFTLEELIAQDNPVRVIDLFVEGLDLNKLQFIAKGKAAEGRPAFDNKILLKLYLYGYLNRIRTSRLLERECERNVEIRYMAHHVQSYSC
jgi:transposase